MTKNKNLIDYEYYKLPPPLTFFSEFVHNTMLTPNQQMDVQYDSAYWFI